MLFPGQGVCGQVSQVSLTQCQLCGTMSAIQNSFQGQRDAGILVVCASLLCLGGIDTTCAACYNGASSTAARASQL